MTMSAVRTKVHTFTSLANPFLVCLRCRRGVSAWHDSERCGCRAEGAGANLPCGHAAGVESVCPSWSPIGGCGCGRTLGMVDHPTIPELAAPRAVVRR